MQHRPISQSRWHVHANAVQPSMEMRGWLTDLTSLTVKLVARSACFRVRRLRQARALCLADEYEPVGLPRRMMVQEREVLLQCDGVPVVYAHTIVPLNATASDWPFFGTLGERSLGTTLFGDPRVRRGELQFARLDLQHPLVQRALLATGMKPTMQRLYARRCLYKRNKGLLLVTEVFLPAILQVDARSFAANSRLPVAGKMDPEPPRSRAA